MEACSRPTTKPPNGTFLSIMAAQTVFRSGARIELVPLDATGKVSIGIPFLREFKKQAKTPLARFVAQVLESDHSAIQEGYFQAWDPLAAVSLVHPAVVALSPAAIQINDQGRTLELQGKPNAEAAVGANPALFKQLFLDAFR